MLEFYIRNIQNLLMLEKQEHYENEQSIIIARYQNNDIKITEFLFAKQRGYITDFQGHSEILKEYFMLIPYLFQLDLFDESLENINNDRKIVTLRDGVGHRVMHVIDCENKLVSIFVVNDKKFNNQLNKRFRYTSNPQERAAISSILSPARPFWRHASMIEELYTHFYKNRVTKED